MSSRPLPSRVYVASRDGAVFGHAALADYGPVAMEPLRIEVVQIDVLEGNIHWPPGEPTIEAASLQLVDLDEEGKESNAFFPEINVQRDGTEDTTPFRIRYLLPGRCKLSLSGRGLAAEAFTIQIPFSGRQVISPGRGQRSYGHSLPVRIVTQSDMPLDGKDGRAELRRIYFYGIEQQATLAPTKLGGMRALGNSNSRTLWKAATAACPSGCFELADAERLIEIPYLENGGTLELVIDDEVPTQMLEIRVIELAQSGSIQVSVRGAGSAEFQRSLLLHRC
ncbi:MAG: hypothetical protein ACI8QS_002413 [Planctomycetota bacterium]|jgi:hypothetical protein